MKQFNNEAIGNLVDHLFRAEAGKLVALLTRLFGASNIELAEDIVQDTLLTALDHWSVGNVPDNPAAWLTQVAKRKALNELNRNKSVLKYAVHLKKEKADRAQWIEEIFLEKEIPDSQLRMMFTCCHPAMSTTSQIALTLKTLCGFGIKEIAMALFSSESNINKRLYRAKQKIRTQQIPFDIPVGGELENRLDAVCLALYLLFNKGYNSSYSDQLIQKDLCLEAMRLTQLLADHFPQHPRIFALLALMCFHAARLEARIDHRGAIIIFEDQDRVLWNKALIQKGLSYLGRSSQGMNLSAYHLEAGIAAEHCLAKNFEETDWESIYQQYELLYKIKSNPVILLNLAIIESHRKGYRASLEKLADLEKSGTLDGYYLLAATQGIFHLKISDFAKAKIYLTKAQQLTESQKEIDFIAKQLALCEG